jgi:hypothetical protein
MANRKNGAMQFIEPTEMWPSALTTDAGRTESKHRPKNFVPSPGPLREISPAPAPSAVFFLSVFDNTHTR